MKRFLDILISASALAVLSPILFIIIVILKLTGEGEVFFFQERIGYKNKSFHITKFVTMIKSAAVIRQGEFTVENDSRVLPVGRFLRKSKINELLQLWDVLRGEMSLVGPRPQVARVHTMYPDKYFKVLDRVRPGITGVGSIVFRDEEGILTRSVDREFVYSKKIVPYKAELEEWYADNKNIFLDIYLMFATLWCVLSPRSKMIFKIIPKHLERNVDEFPA